MFKRIVSIALCIALAGCFTACKDNPDSEDSEYSIIYKYEDVPATDEDDNTDTPSGDSTVNNNNNASSTGSDVKNDNKKNNATGLATNEVRDLKGREIVYVAWWEGTDRNSTAGKKIAEVEKLLNCKFVERKMSEYKALYTSILAGDPIADIFCPYDQSALVLANKGMLTALDTLPSLNLDAKCWDSNCNEVNTFNGHIYGMSRNLQVRNVLVYNKTMFKSNGWDDLYTLSKNGNLTWDKIYEIANKAVQKSGSGAITRYGFVPKYSIAEMASVFLGANGVKVVSREGDTTKLKYNLTASNTAAVTALTALQDWAKVSGLFYDNTNYGAESGRPVFYQGKAAMAMIDSQMFSEVASNANFDIGMVLFPHGPNYDKDYVNYHCVPTSIPAGVKNPDDVALFWGTLRNHMNEDISTITFNSTLDMMPDESVKYTLTKYKTQYLNGGYSHDYALSFDCIDEQFKKIAKGEATPASAITAIGQQINAQLSDYWK